MASKPKIIKGKTFDGKIVSRARTLVSNMELQKCYFEGCSILDPKSPDSRAVIRGIKLINCSERGCSMYAAIIEDTVVDGFTAYGQLFQIWGSVFNRVVLKGKIDRLMISGQLFPPIGEADGDVVAEKYRIADEAYYRNVDWALDISEGQFKELSIQGIPTHLIRRDPETQMVVTHQAAIAGKWRKLELYRDVWSVIFDRLISKLHFRR